MWSETEEDLLKRHYNKIANIDDICILLNKPRYEIYRKAKLLNLASRKNITHEQVVDRLNKQGIIPYDNYNKGTKVKYNFQCRYCDKIFTSKLIDVLFSHRNSCGCVKTSTRKGTSNIPGEYFTNLRKSAKDRNIDFNISIKFIDMLLIKQNFTCALSGLPIKLYYNSLNTKSKNHKKNTASLDRIDSSIGYFDYNVQWVHKDVNKMKQGFNQIYFINLCNKISEKNQYEY